MINIMFIVFSLICLCISIFITCILLFKKEKTQSIHKNTIITNKINISPIGKLECRNYSYNLVIKCITIFVLIFIGFNIGIHIEQYKSLKKVVTNDVNSKYYSSALLVKGEIVPIESINSDNSTNIENIKENNDLLNITPFDILNVKQNIDAIDSYGNLHANSFVFDGQNSYASFILDSEYSFVEFNLSIEKTADMNKEGVLTVITDENVLYMSPVMTKTDAPMDISLPIDNCSVLTIEYNTKGINPCIISDVKLSK